MDLLYRNGEDHMAISFTGLMVEGERLERCDILYLKKKEMEGGLEN